MPSQSRSTQTQTQSTTSTETSLPAIDESQEELRDALKDGGSAEGLSNCRGTLGQWLGTELYTALAGELTMDKLSGHATKAWEDALMSAVDAFDELDGKGGDGSFDPFRKALKETYGKAAEEMMQGDLGQKIVGKLNGWVDTHPKTILLVALLAAGGAVAANVDIPTLKQKFKLGSGFTAKLEANLGKIRDISLNEIKAELEYSSGPILAAAKVSRGEDGAIAADISGKLGDDKKYIKADGKFTEDGLDVYGVSGLFTTGGRKYEAGVTGGAEVDPTISASIAREDGTHSTSGKYDTGSGVLTITDAMTTKLGESTSLKTDVSGSSDGTVGVGATVSGKAGDHTTYSAGLRHEEKDGSTKQTGTGTLSYATDDFTAKGTASVSTDGSGSLSGSLGHKFTDELSGTASGKHTFGPDGTRTTGGLDLTYRGEDWAGTGEYDYDSKDSKHSVSGLVQRDLGSDWKARAEGKISMSDLGTDWEAGGSLYKKLNDDVSVFGGGSYKSDMDGGRFIPKVGVEVKGVPIEYPYDAATKSHKVGVTLFSW